MTALKIKNETKFHIYQLNTQQSRTARLFSQDATFRGVLGNILRFQKRHGSGIFIDERSEIAPCLHGHDRASEETKGLIPCGLPRKTAVGGGCRACPAVLIPFIDEKEKNTLSGFMQSI
jgi:hypothetical protein